MANLQPKRLYTGAATASNTYTAPSTIGSYSIVRSIHACNTTTTDKVFSINIVPQFGSAAKDNLIMSNITVPGNDVVVSDTTIVLGPGDALYLTQATADVVLTISGVEYSTA